MWYSKRFEACSSLGHEKVYGINEAGALGRVGCNQIYMLRRKIPLNHNGLKNQTKKIIGPSLNHWERQRLPKKGFKSQTKQENYQISISFLEGHVHGNDLTEWVL